MVYLLICFYIRDARIVPVCGKGRIAPTASAAKEVLEVEQFKVVAESGYYKDIAPCEAVGIEAYVTRPQRGFAVREGLQGSPLFETTESLFHKLESTIQSGDGGQHFISSFN